MGTFPGENLLTVMQKLNLNEQNKNLEHVIWNKNFCLDPSNWVED